MRSRRATGKRTLRVSGEVRWWFVVNPCRGRGASSDFDAHALVCLRAKVHYHVLAIVNRLLEQHVHRSLLEPFQAEVIEDRRGKIPVDGYSRYKAAQKSISGGDAIVMDLVIRIGGGIHRADTALVSEVDFVVQPRQCTPFYAM